MKNNYNPYTVPENFFANAIDTALLKQRNRKRALRYGIAAAAVALCLLVAPYFINPSDNQDAVTVSDSLAQMYEYDIFLQVNF